ncbi:MAG TPA: PEP-CTERM sorting domain-containing protein [Pyrinomonadaceae bacterium]|nr:PEP-CTERM sorting domain-containing protein [Pyrinomonadaceae bacterium]
MIRKMLLTSAATFMMLALSVIAQADAITTTTATNTTPTPTATISNFTLTGNAFTFTICNTSSSGSITALGFNLPGADRGTFTLTSSSDPDFVVNSQVKAQGGSQTSTSTFDFALLTGKNFGGGNVSEGIAPGTCATFTVTGNFSGLTAQQIAQLVFARFQGIQPGDQSIVVTVQPEAVPEPATMILLGTGLAGAAASVRRRRKAAQDAASSENV